MENSKLKQVLLDTYMNKLGFNYFFNNWFYQPTLMRQDEVLTLSQFISLNLTLKSYDDDFICLPTLELRKKYRRCMKKKYHGWKLLKELLEKNGFDYNDWIQLLPEIKTGKGMYPDFSVLDKQKLLVLPIYKVAGLKYGCKPLGTITKYLRGVVDANVLSVNEILEINKSTKETILKSYRGFKRDVIHTLFVMQKKLQSLGFGPSDGPFMNLKIKPTKTKEEYIQQLQLEKQFELEEATLAVGYGIRAGWIKVQS